MPKPVFTGKCGPFIGNTVVWPLDEASLYFLDEYGEAALFDIADWLHLVVNVIFPDVFDDLLLSFPEQ